MAVEMTPQNENPLRIFNPTFWIEKIADVNAQYYPESDPAKVKHSLLKAIVAGLVIGVFSARHVLRHVHPNADIWSVLLVDSTTNPRSSFFWENSHFGDEHWLDDCVRNADTILPHDYANSMVMNLSIVGGMLSGLVVAFYALRLVETFVTYMHTDIS